MATLTLAPSPVRPRRTSAARMPDSAYMPVAMSATEMPTRDGFLGAGDADQPGLRLDQQIVRLLLRERAALAVAGDVADNELRVPRREIGMAQAEPCRGTRREVLQQHIGAVDQPIQHLRRVGMLQVQRDAALAAIEPDEEAGLAMHEAVVATREIALAGALHLDYVGAEVGQVAAADRRRHRVFQRDDADAFQGSHDRICLPGVIRQESAADCRCQSAMRGGGGECRGNARGSGKDRVARSRAVASHERD